MTTTTALDTPLRFKRLLLTGAAGGLGRALRPRTGGSEAFRIAVETRQPRIDLSEPAAIHQGGDFVYRNR